MSTETTPRDYHSINDEANKAIIQKLGDDAGDTEITEVIACYTIGSSDKEIRKQLSKFLVGPLKKAATYLGCKNDGGPSQPKMLKDDKISFIIRRIESLLKDLCGICNEYYSNTLTDEPHFSCLICHQGCHQPCFEEMSKVFDGMPEKIKQAFEFICTSCKSDFKRDPTTAQDSKKSPVKPLNDHKQGEGEDSEAEINLANQQNTDADGSRTSQPVTTKVDPSDTTIAICPTYKWGRCPTYENCQYRHPPRCWNWLTKGKCSFKKKCRFHHPPLCRQSLWEKQCFNAECKFFHVAKTMRYKMEDEQLKNSLQAATYHDQQQQQPVRPVQMPPPNQAPIPQPPQHPAQTQVYAPQQYQSIQKAQPTHQSHSGLSSNDISFLVKSIKESIREDLEKEVEKIKQSLSLQIQQVGRPSIIATPCMPQTQAIPNQYSYPISGMIQNQSG